MKNIKSSNNPKDIAIAKALRENLRKRKSQKINRKESLFATKEKTELLK